MVKDCSNILVYKEERKRMCASITCDDCGINNSLLCNKISNVTPEYIEIVQKWSDEHPVESRQKKFLKLFPNPLLVDMYDFVDICPIYVDYKFECDRSNTLQDCTECKGKFWLQEVK
nr:MAG TPA: hypothetical protein [Bacteriophage sp.]